ncbi:MAG: hypothetical protein HY900_38105 [Deltaproteobacteria bacterium]|nr:hypothetical protein [Deltaproteobacteria bacterium]
MKQDRARFPAFDRSRLVVRPLAERRHDLDLSAVLPLAPSAEVHPSLAAVAERIVAARASGSAVILMMGAHVIRAGVQQFLIDLLEKGYVDCLAMNGAGVIHDYEFARIGATTESVAAYIRDGRFGLWGETGEINDVVARTAGDGLGLGEAVGRAIEEGPAGRFPNRAISVLAAGWRLGIPVTVHVSIGCDIVHELPNCDGAAYGQASYTDFLRFAGVLEHAEGGVVMNFGSAVMGPEVYLKALAMVRNVARQESRAVADLTTLVCDLVELPADYGTEARKDDPFYYFRPWKTILVRTVADGGRSYYVRGRHRDTIPQLWTAIHSFAKEGRP